MSFNQIFVSWFPMILLIVVWLIVMSKYGKRSQKSVSIMEENKELFERMVVANEQIAKHLEEIANKK